MRELAVDKRQQPLTRVDDADAHAHHREQRRVLHPDRAAADHHERCRDARQLQDAVRVEHELAVERQHHWAVRPRTCRDQYLLRAKRTCGAAGIVHRHLVRPVDVRRPAHQLDVVVPLDAFSEHLEVRPRHLALPMVQVFDRHARVEPRPEPRRIESPQLCQVSRGLAQRLARERAGVRHRATQPQPLDERHALSEVRRVLRRFDASGPGADDHQVVHVLQVLRPLAHHAPPASLRRTSPLR